MINVIFLRLIIFFRKSFILKGIVFSWFFSFFISTVWVVGKQNPNNYFNIDADFYSRIRINHKGGSSFLEGSRSPIDSLGLNFFTHIDVDKDIGVDVNVGFKIEERDPDKIQQLKFNNSYLRVNNLFGIMDIKFYDIGYGAGFNNSIRPDLKVRGAQLYLRPIPQLTLSLGYGISGEELQLHPMSNNTIQMYLDKQKTIYIPNYHAFKFDLLYNNLYVPISFYYGILLVDNAGSYLDKSYLPKKIDDRILHSSLGFTFDFLAYFKRRALGFDIALTLPIGSMSKYVQIEKNRNYDSEINFLFQFYGDAEIAYGFGLSYKLLFALDSHTKQKVLGNLYDNYFKEAFMITFSPRYTYGPISVDFGLMFGIIGGKTARSSIERNDNFVFNKETVYNNLTLETGIDWKPFPFFDLGRDLIVRGYYKFNFGDLGISGDHLNEIGLQIRLSFNSQAID